MGANFREVGRIFCRREAHQRTQTDFLSTLIQPYERISRELTLNYKHERIFGELRTRQMERTQRTIGSNLRSMVCKVRIMDAVFVARKTKWIQSTSRFNKLIQSIPNPQYETKSIETFHE